MIGKLTGVPWRLIIRILGCVALFLKCVFLPNTVGKDKKSGGGSACR